MCLLWFALFNSKNHLGRVGGCLYAHKYFCIANVCVCICVKFKRVLSYLVVTLMKQMLDLRILPLITYIFSLSLSHYHFCHRVLVTFQSYEASVAETHELEFSQPLKNRSESRWHDSNSSSSKHGQRPFAACTPPQLHSLYFTLQPKVGRQGGIWKGIGADRLWKPWQLEQTLGGSILLIYAVFHSPNCFHFTLISKIAVKILNAVWSFPCLIERVLSLKVEH